VLRSGKARRPNPAATRLLTISGIGASVRDLVRDLAYMPAVKQLRLFRSRKLSPVEVLKAQIARIETHGRFINAITYTHFEKALRAARLSECRYRSGGERPLEGLTVALKDEFERAQWLTTHGSRACVARRGKENHPLVRKLLSAGALLHVQTTTPEFHLLPLTWSDRWGVTRNPWNPDITPGGSSGGSAAVTAAGMSTLAVGSDMGGSIRVPAALCGLYGFNPPYGRNIASAEDALLVHASVGPLARTFSDMLLLQRVMCGGIERGVAVSPPLALPDRFPSIKGWKIALSMNQGWAAVEPDVRDNIRVAIRILEDAGARVERVRPNFKMSGSELRQTLERALFSTAVGGEMAGRPHGKLTTYGKRFRKLASRMTAKDARQAAEKASQVHSVFEDKIFSKGYRVLICPTVSSTRIRADYDPSRQTLAVADKRSDPYLGWHQTSLFNLLNWMPVISVPAGRCRNGVPAAFQVAARPYDDLSVMAVASAYAARCPDLFAGGAMPFSD
jgi:Asp-tRNA(Asn)/Glu-tRNA(Gln) amidotransferase A subunit family amidase